MLISYKDTIHVLTRPNIKQIASANVAITKYENTSIFLKREIKCGQCYDIQNSETVNCSIVPVVISVVRSVVCSVETSVETSKEQNTFYPNVYFVFKKAMRSN